MKRFLASLTRISDLDNRPYDVTQRGRDRWASGDYVVCEVVGTPSALYRTELVSGRRTPVLPGQQIVGALGMRAATHDCCGDWRKVGNDLLMNQLTGAGLFGKVTSVSRWSGRPMAVKYLGHVERNGAKLTLSDFVPSPGDAAFALPSVLVAGTSMSAGKTLTSRAVVACLKQLGFRVAAAKLTGAAGYKDALGYGDAGADHIFDYVDAGLSDTLGEPVVVEAALTALFKRIAATDADIFVGEIGASPLEAYNGMTVLNCLKSHIRMLALVANDAYAARGFQETVPFKPDFVTGPAANTSSSTALVRTLTGLNVLDLGASEGIDTLRKLLQEKLG